MENMIKQVAISKLFGDKNIEWQLQKTNVLVGKNGTGKSTILQLIIGAISKKDEFKKSGLCDFINVTVENDDILTMKKELISEDLKNILLKGLKNKTLFSENPKIFDELYDTLKKELAKKQASDMNHSMATHFLTLVPENNIRDRTSNSEISFEFISTINLNANSTQNISLGNGETQNILDLEIKTELDRLLKLHNKQLNQKFIHSLNEMFSESEKQMRLNNDFKLEFQHKDDVLYFPQLSSGERQVIYILLKVAIATQTNALILMDEPEISLHLSWQEKLLTQIRTINPDSQIIIVTHSPAIVMNGWLDCFVDIQDIIVKEKPATYTIKG